MKMKNALLSLTEAVRLARLELACYHDDMCRGSPEGTLARLTKILEDEDMNAAMALIAPDAESPSIIPQENERQRKHA